MHRAATWSLPPEDPLKLKDGTPAEVATSLRRIWEVCPTSDRIVEDIHRFSGALDKIIAAQGAAMIYVPELDRRTGRRTRVTRRFAYHPDCTGALAAIEAKYTEWLASAPRSSPRLEGLAADQDSDSDTDDSSEDGL
jgi:hypothetical protein